MSSADSFDVPTVSGARTGPVIELDHARYVQDPSYPATVLAALSRLAGGRRRGLVVVVIHEGDCCQRESWPETARRIYEALICAQPSPEAALAWMD